MVGGIGLLLGLLTPVAACATLAAMIDAWAVNVSGGAFWAERSHVPVPAAFAAAALLFTGAGAWSLDAKALGRARWPGAVAVVLFVVAMAVAVAAWLLLNGVNPIHLRGEAS